MASITQKITPCLWFDTQAEEAANFYTSVFDNGRIKQVSRYGKAGQDVHGMVADPLFVDPEHGDFRLRSGSPAVQIGFEPWDFTAVGPRP